MTTKLIIDNEAVRQRMGLPDVTGVDEAIDSALTAAHVHFQGLLDTPFEPVTARVDVFYLDEKAYPVIPNGLFRCRLRQAFVKGTPVLAYGDDSFTQSSSVGSTLFKLQADKGIVHVSEELAGKYVSITYAAGFDADNKAPDWLKEAVLAYMPKVMNSQQSTNRSDEAEPQAKVVADLSGKMVEPYMRGTAFHLRPVF